MKRRGLVAFLTGAVLGFRPRAAVAQAAANQAKEPAYERPPMGGVPVNNQCPVCSTMAPPYRAEPITDADGHVLMKPARTRRAECAYCRVVFAQILED